MSCCNDPADVIRPIIKEAEKYYEAQDVEKLLAMYHPDVVMVHKGKSAIYGKDAVGKSFKDLFEMFGKTKSEVVEDTHCATKDCDWIISEGKYQGESEKIGPFKNNFRTIWKKSGDTWLIYNEMYEM